MALPVWGCGIQEMGHQTCHGVTNPMFSGNSQESCTEEGNSPVRENLVPLSGHPSSTGTVKVGVNLRRPLRKAKYF